jgi:hypothetical protein
MMTDNFRRACTHSLKAVTQRNINVNIQSKRQINEVTTVRVFVNYSISCRVAAQSYSQQLAAFSQRAL